MSFSDDIETVEFSRQLAHSSVPAEGPAIGLGEPVAVRRESLTEKRAKSPARSPLRYPSPNPAEALQKLTPEARRTLLELDSEPLSLGSSAAATASATASAAASTAASDAVGRKGSRRRSRSADAEEAKRLAAAAAEAAAKASGSGSDTDSEGDDPDVTYLKKELAEIRVSRLSNFCECVVAEGSDGSDCCVDPAVCACVRDGVGCHNEAGNYCSCLTRKRKQRCKNPNGRYIFRESAVQKRREDILKVVNKKEGGAGGDPLASLEPLPIVKKGTTPSVGAAAADAAAVPDLALAAN